MPDVEMGLTLKNISNILYNLYYKLFVLDCNKKTDTLEYQRVIDMITFYSKLESSVFEYILANKSKDDILNINCDILNDGNGRSMNGYLSDGNIIFGELSNRKLVEIRSIRKLFLLYSKLDCNDSFDASMNYAIERTCNERNNLFLQFLSKEEKKLSEFDYVRLKKARYDASFVFMDDEYVNCNSLMGEIGSELKLSEDISEVATKLCRIVDEEDVDTRFITMSKCYIRACICLMNSDACEIIRDSYVKFLESGFVLDGYGYSLFMDILDEHESLRNSYLNGEYSLKRKF